LSKSFKDVIETLFRIPNKEGEIVPFVLNNVQLDLHDQILEYKLLDILKFRQGGVTSLIMAYFLIECMTQYSVAVMIAHDKDHTEKLLQRCRLFIQLMKGPKPVLSKVNDQEISFPKTYSTFYIGTAGSKTFGRSATITHLHCSEYAFWREPRTLMAGLMQAVPHESGRIFKESTANGFGTLHHKQYMRAMGGVSRFHPIFYPWYIFKEYSSRTPLSMPLSLEETSLKNKFNLTESQLQWRREKIEEFEGEATLFCQEYPSTVEEAFLVSGGSLFPEPKVTPSTAWVKVTPPLGVGSLNLLSYHPNKELHYVFGIDTAGGTGGDYSVIEGLCVETLEEVLSYRTNTLSPPQFAKVVSSLGEEYNIAFLVPEANQHGRSLIGCIKDSKPYNENLYRIYRGRIRKPAQTPPVPILKDADYGFITSSITKYPLIGLLQKMVSSLTLFSTVTVDELRGFGEVGLGQLGNLEAEHDDHVIALALACEGVLKEQLKYREEPVEIKPVYKGFRITLEDIKNSIKPQGKGWFSPQVAR